MRLFARPSWAHWKVLAKLRCRAIILCFLFVVAVSQLLGGYFFTLQRAYPNEVYGELIKAEHSQDRTFNETEQIDPNRIFCWIATYADNHKKKAIHVKETWCWRCDKCVFMSSADDPSLPAIDLGTDENRDHLWEKTKKAFKLIYETDIDNYEWFLKADDDSFFIIENLRYFLSDQDYEEPIYFGAKFKLNVHQGYMSGGAGYVLSRNALELFVTEGLPNENYCSPRSNGDEDVEMGLCMEKLNVTAGDSRDEHDLHRFLPEGPEFFFSNSTDNWVSTYSFYPLQIGRNCCSPLVISFHHLNAAMMHTLEYFVYHVKVVDIFLPPSVTEPVPDDVMMLLENTTF